MPARLKLIVAYDGAQFAGWQSQAHRNSIQDRLEAAVEQICGAKTVVHGAGRTDAGVHALAQCAHFDAPNRRLKAERWVSALNASLPLQIRIMRAAFVPSTFHARFSAVGKVYRYRIWNAPVLPPFELKRAWHLSRPLDLSAADAAAKCFSGVHDFRGFTANRGKPSGNTERSIRRVQLRRSGPLVTLEFEAAGFLYKMVRLMVGATVRVALGKETIEDVRDRLEQKISHAATTRFVAPADGLFLVRVRY